MPSRARHRLLFAGTLLLGIVNQAGPLHAQAMESGHSDRTLGGLRKACVDSRFGYLIQHLVLRSSDRMPNIGFVPRGKMDRSFVLTIADGMSFRWFCPYSSNDGELKV
jgi:hypothetical protein